MFFFKPKKVVVDCFTNQPMVAENYGIKKSSKYIPEWWKKLKSSVDVPTPFGIDRPSPTMKSCTGFLNLFQNSWTVPMWTDLIIETRSDGDYGYLYPRVFDPSGIGSHPRHQYEGGMTDYIHIKLTPPWILWEKTGVNFAFFGADWTLIDALPSVRVVPAIVNYKDQHGLGVNFFTEKKPAKLELEAGTPMVYLAPMTDKKVEFRTQVVSEREWLELDKHKPFFANKFIFRGKWK